MHGSVVIGKPIEGLRRVFKGHAVFDQVFYRIEPEPISVHIGEPEFRKIMDHGCRVG